MQLSMKAINFIQGLQDALLHGLRDMKMHLIISRMLMSENTPAFIVTNIQLPVPADTIVFCIQLKKDTLILTEEKAGVAKTIQLKLSSGSLITQGTENKNSAAFKSVIKHVKNLIQTSAVLQVFKYHDDPTDQLDTMTDNKRLNYLATTHGLDQPDHYFELKDPQ